MPLNPLATFPVLDGQVGSPQRCLRSRSSLNARIQHVARQIRRVTGCTLRVSKIEPSAELVRICWSDIHKSRSSKLFSAAQRCSRPALYGQQFPIESSTHDTKLTRAIACRNHCGSHIEDAIFARLGWNDGHHETWSYVEVYRHASVMKSKRPTSRRHFYRIASGSSLFSRYISSAVMQTISQKRPPA